MSPDVMRKKLVASTVSIIANNGLDKTTTRAIAKETGINEVYIYRHFSDKKDLLSKTFDQLDDELARKVWLHLSEMDIQQSGLEQSCRLFFNEVWRFMIDNREHCLAFIQYYYSPYFKDCSADTHKKRYSHIVSTIKSFFNDEADVWMILNHVLNVMLDFAVKVHFGQMSEEDDYTEHIFRVIYRSIEQYFKTTKESDS